MLIFFVQVNWNFLGRLDFSLKCPHCRCDLLIVCVERTRFFIYIQESKFCGRGCPHSIVLISNKVLVQLLSVNKNFIISKFGLGVPELIVWGSWVRLDRVQVILRSILQPNLLSFLGGQTVPRDRAWCVNHFECAQWLVMLLYFVNFFGHVRIRWLNRLAFHIWRLRRHIVRVWWFFLQNLWCLYPFGS